MKQRWIAAMVVGVAMLAGSAAQANDKPKNANPKSQCLKDAGAERKTCSQVCKDDFLTAVDTCRGLNHDCAQAARDARDLCVGDVLRALRQCVEDTCGDTHGKIEDCRNNTVARSTGRDECVDAVQVDKFQCRDACRESVQLFQSLKACRDEFKADLKLCPVPEPLPAP